MNRRIAAATPPADDLRPVLFFNASARLEGLNLNAAFNMLSSWGVQLAGRPVIHFGCRSGMSQCVLGAGLGDPLAPPPCQGCIRHTKLFTGGGATFWFDYQSDPELSRILDALSVAEMQELSYQGRPLGPLVLPSLRWILRRHHLDEDHLTRHLFSKYILSANNIAVEINKVMDDQKPDVVVVFNGLQYPEAVVRWAAKQRGIRVVTHEVNLQPFSAFFTDQQATIYPMDIPESFHLDDRQNELLDRYLEKRFQGDFKMAGVQFWSKMDRLPEDFLTLMAEFKAVVPVFTNVIFDTSQAHANTIFTDMFEWLDLVLEKAVQNPEILFVIRAHPDEMRKGKASQESVLAWAEDRDAGKLRNVKLIGPDETLSSYELIQRSRFVMVYNSSIGLEATLLGAAVLCAGRARYTQYPTVFYPDSRANYIQALDEFLSADQIEIPGEYYDWARKFLFFQLYRTSLSFEEFLVEHPTPGYVQLRDLSLDDLQQGRSPILDLVVKGILEGTPFVLENDLS
jgi:hypothetical protein